MQHAFVLARIRLTRMAAERGPILSGERGQVGRFCITVAYWSAFALRGRPLSAALSSPASAARLRVFASRFRTGPHSPYEDGR
jgi:hypothetical protein